MGRFSPNVLPNSGEVFGHALEGGLNAFLQARRMRIGQDETMLGRGYRVQDDSDTQPQAAAAQPVAPVPEQPSVPPAQLAPALNGPPPTNFKGRPTAAGLSQPPAVDPQLMAQALHAHVQSGQPLQAPNATPQPQQVSAALGTGGGMYEPIKLGGRTYVMTQQERARMDLARALTGADIRAKDAETHKNTREADRLQLGDPGYAGAEGDRAGAVANAEVPAHVTQAVQTALATLPIDVRKLVISGDISLRHAMTLQAGQQGFEHGEHVADRTFKAGQQERELEGQLGNKIAETQYTQGGQLGPTIVRAGRAVMGLPQTTPPSVKGRPALGSTAAASPAQQLWDQAVALHGKDKVVSEYGERPQ